MRTVLAVDVHLQPVLQQGLLVAYALCLKRNTGASREHGLGVHGVHALSAKVQSPTFLCNVSRSPHCEPTFFIMT